MITLRDVTHFKVHNVIEQCASVIESITLGFMRRIKNLELSMNEVRRNTRKRLTVAMQIGSLKYGAAISENSARFSLSFKFYARDII